MDNQNEAVAFLSDPRNCADRAGKIERIDTHAARVFLSGDRAYKIKRAIQYPYLDFSTLALRERALRREFALNRRTAPSLYLGVKALTRARNGGLEWDGSGDCVEWVLVMRRFDQRFLFDRMAEAEQLSPEMARDLADHIAAFHDAAPVVATPSSHGGMAKVLQINRDGFAQSANAYPTEIARAMRYQDAAARDMNRLRPLLDERRDKGHVRHCHGDLHLGNICLLDGAPVLFDCIEFNDELAEIDVLYDLAFLLMDLGHRCLANLANAVFNRYFDRRDEVGGAPALTFFLSTRAAVRAHVGFAAARTATGADHRAHRAQSALTYLEMAEALLAPAPARLIAIGGLSGSGKSTLAAALAPGIGPAPGARVLRSDVERKRQFGLAPEERLPPDAYRPAVSKKVYEELLRQAEIWLGAGRSVIIDAVFSAPEEREAARKAALSAGKPFFGIWLEAPVAIMRQRIEGRTKDASDATASVLERQATYDLGPIDWQIVAAGRHTSEILEQARTILAAG